MTEGKGHDQDRHDDVADKPKGKRAPDLAGGDDIAKRESVGTPGSAHNIVDQYAKKE